MVPRAYGSQCGVPSPVNAGTKAMPPLSGTDAASASTAGAESMIPRLSRSHCTAAPVMKMLPSSAYCSGCSGRDQAIVDSSPLLETERSPEFITTNDPVPYVFFAMPGRKQRWPKSAAC